MNFKQKFVTSTAMALTLISGYGRRSYAACVSTGAPNYLCSGTNTSGQNISGVHNAHVTTAPGFGVNTNTGNAVVITGDGDLHFVDTNNSNLQATAGWGLYVLSTGDNGATPGSVLINVNGTIFGQGVGVSGANLGTGSLSITAGGDVTAASGNGIVAESTGTDLLIETSTGSTVSSQYSGMYARNLGSGVLSITVGGDVTSANADGIFANNYGTDLLLETSVGSTISANGSGVNAFNNGTGTLSITAGGDVIGTNRDGIYAFNASAATDLNIETSTDSTVLGGNNGIYARNSGTGSLSITAGGDVTSVNGTGIVALNSGAGTDLTIETASGSTVSAQYNGISAQNNGTGSLSIIAGGDVVSMNSTGIFAYNYGTDLTIETTSGSAVLGRSIGIYARNYGTGSLSITAGGDVTGEMGLGIYARNNGTDLLIETYSGSTVSAGDKGIDARNFGTGSLSIAAEGEIFSYRDGIYARNDGTNLTVTNGADSSITSQYGVGISARNNGNGSLSIAMDGNISAYGTGIRARNYGTDLTITTANNTSITSRYGVGIYAQNNGSGHLSITSGGDIVSSGDGIYARNNGTDLTVAMASGSTVAGGSRGIAASNSGTGSLSITADGDVTGTNLYGVYAVNIIGTDLTIETGGGSTVLGGYHGINAYNLGTGLLSIVAESEITGNAGYGINTRAYGTGLSIETLSTATVSGGLAGISARNYNAGSLSITNHGIISGDWGITLRNQGGTSTGIFTDGVIEGTAGIAINFLSGSQTTATPIEIAGGRIIGDIVDMDLDLGFSPVTVTGDFSSEGNFRVSDFNVASGADFTLNSNNEIISYDAVDVDGVFNANGGSVSANLRVNTGGVLNVNEDFVSDTGSFTNNGTTSIATGKNLVVDTMIAGTGELRFGFNNVNDHALLTVNSGAADLTGQHIVVDVTGVTGLSSGQQALIVTGVAPLVGGPGGTAVDVDDTSVLWNFRMVDGTGVGAPTSANDLFLIAGQAAPINNLTSTTNNENTANVLMTLQSTTNPELALIVGNMNGASTAAAFNEVLEAAQPLADASERMMQSDFLRRTQNMIGARLNELRSLSMPEAEVRFGMKEDETSQPVASGLQVWGYGFGTPPEQGDHGLNDLAVRQWLAGSAGYTHQSRRQGIDGFDAVSGGAAFGIDTGNTYADRVFGLAVGYGHAEVDSNNANRAENEIDSLQLLAYASKNFSNNYYGDLKASYAQASNDTTRYDVGGVPGLTANGDFTSKQAGLQANVGRRILRKDYLITPEFGVNWLHYTSDGYTETGAGGANLTVDTKSADSVEIGGSVRIVKEIKRDSGAIILPELRAGYYYDVIGDPIQKTVSFAGGGSSFAIESPNPSQHRINLGAGVTVKGTGNWDYSLNYSLDMQSQAQNHNLVAKASWKF